MFTYSTQVGENKAIITADADDTTAVSSAEFCYNVLNQCGNTEIVTGSFVGSPFTVPENDFAIIELND